MTGYELKKFFDTSVAHFWNAEQSQIYAALKQLEAEDLVEMRVEMQTDRPNRKVYSITQDGRDELLEWLATPAEPEQVREPLLIKIFFGRALQRQQLIAVLKSHAEELRRTESMYAGDALDTVRKFAAAAGMEDDARLWALTVDAGIAHHHAIVEWAEHAIAQLERMDDAMFGASPIDPNDQSHIDARTAQKILDKLAEGRPGLRVSARPEPATALAADSLGAQRAVPTASETRDRTEPATPLAAKGVSP
jgi:DNA-binding PadR family transcriptional regulator